MTQFRHALLALCLVLSACASGPKLSEVRGGLATQPADQGRVYFYRTAFMGAAVQPTIRLNTKAVGACQPGGVSYTDVPPGDYDANVSTEVTRSVTFTLAAGEQKYVRCYIGIGLLVGRGYLELVDPTVGESEIKDLVFLGN